jgi:hypothetical protein
VKTRVLFLRQDNLTLIVEVQLYDLPPTKAHHSGPLAFGIATGGSAAIVASIERAASARRRWEGEGFGFFFFEKKTAYIIQ